MTEESLVSAEQSFSIPVKLLSRKRRIEMFVDDYYFGHSLWINIMRIIGGPITIVLGIYLYRGTGKFTAAYGGFCFVYGLYYALKPVLWILFRIASFKSIPINIEVTEASMAIKDDGSNSEISFHKFLRIRKRKDYYIFRLPNLTNIYLPQELLSPEQKLIIDTKLTR